MSQIIAIYLKANCVITRKSILKHIDRDSNNKRLYTDDDIEMIKFIQCLSNLNMPLKKSEKHRHALSKPNRCPKRVTHT